eukprot:TRINITY_DN6187_c0_g1_i3.p1 TRINITY_DN6187_c0_g1~~TRINITY_DN6187_c0_g1_i3.p1  ORF type:complete len:492 (+),score=134.60 TRINITY_DN6187_c0_g1_i3:3-1478(+)
MILVYLFLFLIGGFVLYWKTLPNRSGPTHQITGRSIESPFRNAPFPLGHITRFIQTPWESATLMRETAQDGFNRFWLSAIPLIVPLDVNYIKTLLSLDHGRDIGGLYILNGIIGKGLISAGGQDWQRQHRILSRAFTPSVIRSFGPQMSSIIEEKLFRVLDKAAETRSVVDLGEILGQLTMHIVVATSLGGDISQLDEIVDAMRFLSSQMSNQLLLIPGFHHIPTSNNIKVKKTFQKLDKIIYEIIQNKRRQWKALGDEEKRTCKTALDVLVDANDEDYFSDVELRDNVCTFFSAGSDTTQTAVLWTLIHLLSTSNLKAKQRLLDEIDSVLGTEKFSVDKSPLFPYYHAAVNETLRLTPPLMMYPMRIMEDDVELGPWNIPKGSRISIVSIGTSHDPKLWEDPLEFRPERFLESNVIPNASIPFGIGKRTCIGRSFALQEMQYVIISMLQRYDIELESETNWKTDMPCTIKFPIIYPSEKFCRFRISKRSQ